MFHIPKRKARPLRRLPVHLPCACAFAAGVRSRRRRVTGTSFKGAEHVQCPLTAGNARLSAFRAEVSGAPGVEFSLAMPPRRLLETAFSHGEVSEMA